MIDLKKTPFGGKFFKSIFFIFRRCSMNTKYIFITGGVVSGLGKGITASALGRLLKN